MEDTQVIIRRARAKLAKASKKKDIEDIREEVSKVLGTLEPIKEFYGKISRTELIEIKGEDGEDGYTPVKGVDYFDGKDGYTPVKGKDYFDGKDGKDGKNGKDGERGLRGLSGKDGKDGRNGKDGKDGKDGSPDTPYEIRDKLSSLKGSERLDAKHIKNLAKQVGSVTITGVGGGTATSVTEHIADTDIHVPIYIQDTEPSNPTLNDLWVDTSI